MKPERWQQITDLFQSAVKRGPAERTRFLDERCAGDPSLRREVEAMIESHDSAGSFIESPAYEVGAALLDNAPPPAHAGSTVGPYKIVSLLGAGGMGEVYLADDARLGRRVALKLLPAGIARDDGRVLRFQQEARAASALNHPNILSIYDTGTTDDGAPYVVSELLEGETLRERLAGGALPARKAADYALQVARGLSAAHSKGIIHRDLKPENLFVTADGRVKILDFGIAKLAVRGGHGAVEGEAPTMLVKTEPGLVIGTAGYMSPEQARGHEADHRSDIFSFGCVLYEMLSGRRAFEGNSAVEVLNAILKEEPPEINEAGGHAAPALERIARRCLEKNPAERFQSASDLAFALEPLSGVQSGSQAATSTRPAGASGRRGRGRLVWLVAGALVAGMLGALAFFAGAYFRGSAPDVNVVRLPISIPQKTSFVFSVEEHNLSVSPDGAHLAYVATSEGRRMLWVRPLGALATKALPGTEGASSPFWSADARHIAFFADGKLKRIEATGASLRTVCSLSTKRRSQGAWGSGGTIIFLEWGEGGRIFRVPAEGGTPAPLENTGQPRRAWFHFLPDGKRFIYYGSSGDPDKNDGGIYAGSLDSPEIKLVLATPPARAQYVRPGYLLYPREGSLMARPFDEQNLRFTGEASVVVESLPFFDKIGWMEFSASNNGVLVYMLGYPTSRLVWLDRGGRETRQVGEPGDIDHVRLSPDGQKLALTICNTRDASGCDLWIHDLARDTRTRFVSGPTDDSHPIWSPDGRRLAYFSCCEGESPLHIKELNDTGKGQTPLGSGFPHTPFDWSSDGRFMLYSVRHPTAAGDVWVLPLSGDLKPYPLLQTQYDEMGARLSPDGRWVAYVSDESGQNEVYVARFERPGERWRVSTAGGNGPRWRRDGKELFYRAADSRLMAVEVRAAEAFEAGSPAPLYQTQAEPNSGYDVTGDGQRFLVRVPEAVSQSLQFAAVLNWTADLKR